MDENYSRTQLMTFAKLTDEDLQQVNQCRRAYNRLGFGYQIGFVRLLNRFPTQHPFEILDDLLTFVSLQVQVDESEINSYQRRRQTVSQHQIRIRDYLNLNPFGPAQREFLRQFVHSEACRLEQTHALLLRAEQFLRDNRILRPATSTLQRIIGEQRTAARADIFAQITNDLPIQVIQRLDTLLSVEEGPFSALQQLKEPPGKASAAAMNRLADKLACIEETGVLGIDLSWLNNNYQRSLASYVRKCNAYWLRQIEPAHRYGAMVCYLLQTYGDTIDFMVDMHDKLINRVRGFAKDAFDRQLLLKRRAIDKSLSMFLTLGGVVLDEAVSDETVRSTIFSKVQKEDLAVQMAQLEAWEKEKPNHVFTCVVSQFSYLRKFSPAFLKHLEFDSDSLSHTSLVDATTLLKEMNDSGKRKLPEETPIAFIPKKLRPLLFNEGEIDKHAWEYVRCAQRLLREPPLLTKVRDEMKAGNLTVKKSKRFGPFDRFFLPENQWVKMREEFFGQSGLPVSGTEAVKYLTNRLAKAYDRFLTSLPSNTYAQVDGNRWHLSVDSPEPLDPTHQAKLEQLKGWLSKKIRQIKLPQLLIEVDNELQFTHHFLPPAQNQNRPKDEIAAIIATVMAHGCNVGPDIMAQLIPSVTYRQIKRITDWQLTEETQRSALALIVNAIANLDTSKTWGEGKTSASDGQRFAFRSNVLQQTYSHKFSDFAIEFYSFVADNYAPFSGVPIECNERDAPYVLDGVLYNESDLQLDEHYTDTVVYEVNH